MDSDIRPWTIHIGQWMMDVFDMENGQWTMDNGHLVLNIKLWTMNIGNWTFANRQ